MSIQKPSADEVVTPVIKSRLIGNYLIGKTLGEGTFGKVKMGTHQLTGEKVAIKILEKDRIIEVADVERVQREIHILKLVRHPHVIQLYEIIETPKHIFLVMEFISGGELFDYIVKSTKLDEVEACKFLQELISGVEYLHKLKVVHRDLKPENLLLDHNKNIKIVDFGLSNTYKQDELLQTACGSPCYAAPEMIAGQKYNGMKVDIWSCGVILFAGLCGYLPFEDQNTSALYKKILSGEYTLPIFLSPLATSMIKQLLNTDPQLRFNILEIRQHAWYLLYKRSYEIPPGIVVGYNRIPVDQSILTKLKQYGLQLDYTQKCLDANKHNHDTTTYHLVLKRHLLDGGQSSADLNSEAFDINLLEPKPRPSKLPMSTLVNNEVIRQQLKEDSRERSYSTDKEACIHQQHNKVYKQTHNGYRLSNTGNQKQLLEEIVFIFSSRLFQKSSFIHDSQSVPRKTAHLINQIYSGTNIPSKEQGQIAKQQIYNPVYKNRQIVAPHQVKLRNQINLSQIDYNRRIQSTKSKQPDQDINTSIRYRSNKDRSLIIDDQNHYYSNQVRRQYASVGRRFVQNSNDITSQDIVSGRKKVTHNTVNTKLRNTFEKFLIG